jgi:ferredoxin
MRKLILTARPTQISAAEAGCAPIVTYSNGVKEKTSCIGCAGSPCINYKEDEISISGLSSLSFDQNLNTCPTSAIKLVKNSAVPVIDTNSCINCGVCTSRCPTGAIYLSDSGKMTIASGARKCLQPSNGDNVATENAFIKVAWNKPIIRDDDKIALTFTTSYKKASRISGSRIHNLLSRNLLIELGLKAGASRTGDVNNRMDLYIALADKSVATEVEISGAQIDAPRSVLDSMAVLHGRHKIAKKHIDGLIIVGELPNARSEFWTVLKDIESVLKIKIKVLTTTAAAILVHNKVKLSKIQELESSLSIRKLFETKAGRKLCLNTGAYSAFEAEK